MREIKLNAWDSENEQMLIGYEPSDQPKREYVPFEFGVGFSHFDKSKLILLQWIGLHDRNGDCIHDGHIIECRENKLVYLVEWLEKECRFVGRVQHEVCGVCSPWKWGIVDIIGNKFETPELLKERE